MPLRSQIVNHYEVLSSSFTEFPGAAQLYYSGANGLIKIP